MSIYKAYAALSNKNAPEEVVETMRRLVHKLNDEGYTLRTAGNEGPEESLEAQTEQKEVHIPWKGFNNRESRFNRNDNNAIEIVQAFHPTFASLKPAVQAIIARSAHVILGKDLRSPVRFLVCWSEDGLENAKDRSIKSGYMGMPVAVANSLSIPVFNLKNADATTRLRNFLNL